MSATSLGGWFLSRSLGKKLVVGVTIAGSLVGFGMIRSFTSPTVAPAPVGESRSLEPLFDHLASLPVVKKWFGRSETKIVAEVLPAPVMVVEQETYIVGRLIVEAIPAPAVIVVPELIAAPQIVETQIVEAITAPHEIVETVAIESIGLPHEVVNHDAFWARQLESVQQVGFQLMVGLEVFLAQEPKKDPEPKIEPKTETKAKIDIGIDEKDLIAEVNKYIADTKDNPQPFIKTLMAEKLSLAPDAFKFDRKINKLTWKVEAKPTDEAKVSKALSDLFIEILVQRKSMDAEKVKGWWAELDITYQTPMVAKVDPPKVDPPEVIPTPPVVIEPPIHIEPVPIVIIGSCDCGPAPTVHAPIVIAAAPTVHSCDGCGSMPAPVITHCAPVPMCEPAPACETKKHSLFGGGRLFGRNKCR